MTTPTYRPSAESSPPIEQAQAQIRAYRRLAEIDPPALRSLIVELVRLSDESAASALHARTAEAVARAERHARRAADARAALAGVELAD